MEHKGGQLHTLADLLQGTKTTAISDSSQRGPRKYSSHVGNTTNGPSLTSWSSSSQSSDCAHWAIVAIVSYLSWRVINFSVICPRGNVAQNTKLSWNVLRILTNMYGSHSCKSHVPVLWYSYCMPFESSLSLYQCTLLLICTVATVQLLYAIPILIHRLSFNETSKLNLSMSVSSFPIPPCYWPTINHIPDEELVFQLAICKNNKYFIYNLTFVPEIPTEQQKENKIPRSWKIIDLSMTYCKMATFLLFQVRPAMSHVCRARQCIRRSISPSTFLSTLDVMVTSFSNVNNFFFPVFKDKALYNFSPPFFWQR